MAMTCLRTRVQRLMYHYAICMKYQEAKMNVLFLQFQSTVLGRRGLGGQRARSHVGAEHRFDKERASSRQIRHMVLTV